MRPLTGSLILAFLFWFIIFFAPAARWVNFWYALTAATGILAGVSLLCAGTSRDRIFSFRFSHIAAGVFSALFLYGVFWLAHAVLSRVFVSFSGQVASVYRTKALLPSWSIAILLFFWIGPLEEVYWRGFVQRRCVSRWGESRGYLGACFLYAAVHLFSCNAALIAAAFFCGLFWGWLFRRYKSLWPGIISHAVWDLLIFMIVPL